MNPQEDDRKPIFLSLGSGASALGQMRLRAIQGGSNIALWTQQVGGGLELLPATLWVEGVSRGRVLVLFEDVDDRLMQRAAHPRTTVALDSSSFPGRIPSQGRRASPVL